MIIGVRPLIDTDGTTCALQSNNCTTLSIGRGGEDEHHAFPISMGGAADQTTMLTLCALHHRRQHALIRYLVELDGAGEDWAVTCHFTAAERDQARLAVANWVAAGKPTIAGWPCPAARA